MQLVSRMVGEALAAALYLGLVVGLLSVLGHLLAATGLFHAPGIARLPPGRAGLDGSWIAWLAGAFVQGAWWGAKWGAVLGAAWGAIKTLADLGRPDQKP